MYNLSGHRSRILKLRDKYAYKKFCTKQTFVSVEKKLPNVHFLMYQLISPLF